ncbi:MAG: phosphoenolpyruvate--protein phosphotransferase [Sedimentisphaerales bacterium]|jgi:phosphotransferase system enzyme I (PtsI)|nr:phosphoenolpyruvate--protein phosphotransferase [Sedimentisphaerales bacterium]NLZ03758.1 phosphoenolpyruvate--protein phosphotransferase [Phycisphaerae bacterium]HNY78756.1 phosphoenolpyruvate--protein phosphotransferase [Sedimentisphaerales bacterium]HOC63991.1 phosphoenolpyruvate--protein phosphotransferase [Sedimentisphaerales bacterium]HOH62879.1 phosphoenolpyruvate--protein phosphotransferase [Sedimentisphaerales bacterium]
MEIKKGIAVSPGVSIGKCLIIDSEDYRIPRRQIEPSQRMVEIQRARNAFGDAIDELSGLEQAQTQTGGGRIKDIFAVHLRLLRDRSLRRQVTDLIHGESVTAEYAVASVLRRFAARFAEAKDTYISERAADIYDIERRLLRHLLGDKREDLGRLREEVIVVARELSPTQTAGFNKAFVKGIASDAGGRTSHAAIVARSLGIPAVVALEDLTEIVRGGDAVIVDGNRGLVIVDPDAETVEQYEAYSREFIALEHKLDAIREKPAETRDGARITLLGNIEFPDEAEIVLAKGGEGIGLYRTEFLYLNRPTEPSEEEHYSAYAQTVHICHDRPVVIRTVDLGADKYTQRKRFAPEPNPFLGLRSIRFCLQNLAMFKTQLRAILRASVLGPVKVMFPLISGIQELMQAKMILHDVMEDLDEEGIAYNRDMEVGIMVETPSAALTASTLARDCDFFSIGTNDLTQYTLAVDRGNELVSTLYSPADPAVLRLVRTVIQDAYKAQIDLCVCGEMASEPEYIMVLLGLGVRTLSLSAPLIPEVKQIIRCVTLEDCNLLTRKVLGMNSERQISNYLRNAARKVLPEAF